VAKKTRPGGVADTEPPAFEIEAPKLAPTRGQTLKVRRIGNSLGVVLPKEVLARNHPFVDGNKRTALIACEFVP
jgi:hypothetical protein